MHTRGRAHARSRVQAAWYGERLSNIIRRLVHTTGNRVATCPPPPRNKKTSCAHRPLKLGLCNKSSTLDNFTFLDQRTTNKKGALRAIFKLVV